MRPTYQVNKLYKDALHGKISGVCSGLARYWQVPRLLIRVAAVICLFMLPLVTAVAYVTATLLLPKR